MRALPLDGGISGTGEPARPVSSTLAWHASVAPARAILGFCLGTSLGVPLVLALGLAGAKIGAPAILVAASAGALLVRRSMPVQPPLTLPRAEDRSLLLLSRLALAVAIGAFLAKIVVAPLWSWDHLAIWGVKARQMVQGGYLDLSFLDDLDFQRSSRADHPLGLPLLWIALSLGGVPGAATFKVSHALLGLSLVLLVRHGALQRGVAPATANAFGALAAASPLLWDSEALGLAELPLALWSVAVVVALRELHMRAWAAGVLIGFLPWIKQEGLTMAILLVAFAAATSADARSLRHRASLLATALPLGLGALAVQRFILPPGMSFFIGDCWARAAARLSDSGRILEFCGATLLHSDWLGFWPVLLLATIGACFRRGRAAALCGVVWVQLAIYTATAFFTYLDPIDHLRAAYFRIAAALVPLGLLAIAEALGPPESMTNPREARREPGDRMRWSNDGTSTSEPSEGSGALEMPAARG